MINLDDIKLISIAPETDSDRRPVKEVTLRLEQRGGDALTATFVVGEDQVRDEELVNVARDWFHRTCKDIAAATESWAMNEERHKAAKHPRLTPQTVGRPKRPEILPG